ncbi:MAG: hypothetical protein WC967_05455 [Balneolaceae bacterium]
MIDKVLENIAVLLLEVIGFIASPIYLFALTLLIIEIDYEYIENILEINNLILFLGIYVIGYIIRSGSLFFGNCNHFDIRIEVEEEISDTEIYQVVKSDISKKINIDENKLSFRDIRNIEFSKRPPIADKAYLFMFRANLFFDIFIINLVSIFLVLSYHLIYLIIISFFGEIVNGLNVITSLVIVFIAFILWKPLLKARKYFFRISYSLPITHYIAHEKL